MGYTCNSPNRYIICHRGGGVIWVGFGRFFFLSLFFVKLTAINSVQTCNYLLPYMSSNISHTSSYLWIHPCGAVLRYLKVPEYTQITPPGGVIWVYLHSLIPGGNISIKLIIWHIWYYSGVLLLRCIHLRCKKEQFKSSFSQ